MNGLYAAFLDGNVGRIVLGSPPASHTQGPTYLGILRYTDIPEVVALMGSRVRLYGEIPAVLRPSPASGIPGKTAVGVTLADALR